MLIRPRQVRRSSKFTSRLRSDARQRREYAASTASMAAIKAILAVALATAGIRAYQAISAQTSNISLSVKLVVPMFFLAAALLVARSCVKNFRAVREISQNKRTSDDR